eukprot:12612888-Alexandrium_andersonii.AAC.1
MGICAGRASISRQWAFAPVEHRLGINWHLRRSSDHRVHCPALPCPAMPCLALPCLAPALPCPALPWPGLACPGPPWPA